jgi:hypothetical protein
MLPSWLRDAAQRLAGVSRISGQVYHRRSRRRDGRCRGGRDLAYVHGPKTVAAFGCASYLVQLHSGRMLISLKNFNYWP